MRTLFEVHEGDCGVVRRRDEIVAGRVEAERVHRRRVGFVVLQQPACGAKSEPTHKHNTPHASRNGVESCLGCVGMQKRASQPASQPAAATELD